MLDSWFGLRWDLLRWQHVRAFMAEVKAGRDFTTIGQISMAAAV